MSPSGDGHATWLVIVGRRHVLRLGFIPWLARGVRGEYLRDPAGDGVTLDLGLPPESTRRWT